MLDRKLTLWKSGVRYGWVVVKVDGRSGTRLPGRLSPVACHLLHLGCGVHQVGSLQRMDPDQDATDVNLHVLSSSFYGSCCAA